MKLQGLNVDPNMHLKLLPVVGGDRNTDGALARALEEFEQYGVDGTSKYIVLLSFGAPTMTHEPCVLDDYVSPTLQKLRDMDIDVTFHGIGLDTAVMDNMKCIADGVPDEDMEDYFTNTETATALAEQWGYTECAYGDQEDGEENLSGVILEEPS